MRRKAKKTKHDSQTTRRKKHTTTATKTHSAGGKRSKKEDINHDNNHAATYDKRKAKQAGTMEERPPANSRHPCEAGSAHLQAHGPEARLHLALYFGVDNASRVPARRAQEGAPVPHRRHPELAQGTRTRTQSDAIGADLFSANVFAPHGTESHAPHRTAPHRPRADRYRRRFQNHSEVARVVRSIISRIYSSVYGLNLKRRLGAACCGFFVYRGCVG